MNKELFPIIVVDDDPSVRKGLSRVLSAAGYPVTVFSSAGDFLDGDAKDRTGCIILDVKMPQMSGLELQEELAGNEYAPPIIFISAHGDIPTAARTMKRGAVDFLTKPLDRDALLAAVETALEKNTRIREHRRRVAAVREKLSKLTPREYEVMTYVITGILNKQIAAELKISEETVKIHRGKVMKKLDIISVPELVRLCQDAGVHPASTGSW